MSIPVKFIIGVFSLVVSLMVVMAWFDGEATYITANHMTGIAQIGDTSMVTGTQTTGETSKNVQMKEGTWDTIMKWIDFDFSFWYTSIETGWTQTTCEAAGGIWDANDSSTAADDLCKFPSQWDLVHTMIFRPIGWGITLGIIAIGLGKLVGTL